MDPETTIPLWDGVAKFVGLAQIRESEAWSRVFANKCKDHRYYELIEHTLANEFEDRKSVV